MNTLHHLDVTYTQWKNMRSFLAGTSNTYYIESSEGYVLVLVDLIRKFVTTCQLKHGNPQGPANILDFETSLKTTATIQSTVDDCVAAAIIG